MKKVRFGDVRELGYGPICLSARGTTSVRLAQWHLGWRLTAPSTLLHMSNRKAPQREEARQYVMRFLE